jgi:hypothetical protein
VTSFDELIGSEPEGSERNRLRSVHELLVEAGPPPELTPEIEAGPTLAMTLNRARRAKKAARSRRMLVPLIAAAALLTLVIGLASGLGSKGHYPTIALQGTVFAPNASGALEILRPKAGEKQPMRITVSGLPSSKHSPYVVYLVRNGHVAAPCGSFAVTDPNRTVTRTLHSPYRLSADDSWIVKGRVGLRYVTVLQQRL